MAIPKIHDIELRNGVRKFSALSNFTQRDVFNGPKNRKWTRVVLFLHGFPDNKNSFNDVIPVVREKFLPEKLLMISPSMRGYEPSSQGPEGEYRVSDFAEDVRAWIVSIAPGDAPVHLVGHDWGAIAAFKTASLYPELVTSMVCLAIPYISNLKIWEFVWYSPEQIYLSSYMLTMQFASIYRQRLENVAPDSYLNKLWQYWSPTWAYSRESIADVHATLLKPGVIDAATSYYRCLFKLLNFKDRRWNVDFKSVPTLILGGRDDGCMTHRLFEYESKKLASVEEADVQILDNVGHFLHRENPKIVGEFIANWLLSHK